MYVQEGVARMVTDRPIADWYKTSGLEQDIQIAVNLIVSRRSGGVLIVQMRKGESWKLPQRSVKGEINWSIDRAIRHILSEDLGIRRNEWNFEPIGNWENELPIDRGAGCFKKDIRVGFVEVPQGISILPKKERYKGFSWERSEAQLSEKLGINSDDEHQRRRAICTLEMVRCAKKRGFLPGFGE